ncbi:hypothetical protein ACFX1R_037290 [Malus domestica]
MASCDSGNLYETSWLDCGKNGLLSFGAIRRIRTCSGKSQKSESFSSWLLRAQCNWNTRSSLAQYPAFLSTEPFDIGPQRWQRCEGHKVILNVYDLSQGLARQMSMAVLGKAIEGIWHTGLVVYGNEYYFGGGIKHAPAGSTAYGTPIKVVDLGVTHVPKDVFEIYLQGISPRYTVETYRLLTHNCNNFSNEVAQFLVGATIPDYILQLPNEVMGSPMGAPIMPVIQNLEATLKSGAARQAPRLIRRLLDGAAETGLPVADALRASLV